MAGLIIPLRLELFVVTIQSTISRECTCQRPVRTVLQRWASRTAAKLLTKSKNVNEMLHTEKDPDVAVRASLAGRPEQLLLFHHCSYCCSIILDNSATVGSLPFGVNE